MSDILVLGGGQESVGAYIAYRLSDCTTLSRSTIPSIDVLDPDLVREIVKRECPRTIIFAPVTYQDQTGQDPRVEKLGSIVEWQSIYLILDTKIRGAYHTVDIAVALGVENVIFLAGAEVSGDPQFCHFTIMNGALWGLTRFASRHTPLNVYYLEMGFVFPSRAAKHYVGDLDDDEARKKVVETSITPDDVVRCIEDIVAGKYPRGSRIVLNKDVF
jgi:hypothetical protein